MINFNKQIQKKFNTMQLTGKLFRVKLTGYQIWDLYINSFSKEDNPKFRDPLSSSKNCNHCKNFIRRYGNIVSIDADYKVSTIFDVETKDEYKHVAEVLSKAIKESQIENVFYETFDELKSLPYESCTKSNSVFRLGVASNVKRYTKEEAEKYGVVKPNETRTFNHVHLDLNKEFVDATGASIEAIMGTYRDSKDVFQKAMEVISIDTLKLVKDLITQGSLLDGEAHKFKVLTMIALKEQYDRLSPDQRDNFCWVASYKLPIARFKNELMGKLCTDLSEGLELNKACQEWNKRVDPVNYMKATAPITKKQIEEAKLFVEENGYAESFDRRFATIDDIKASEILHLNSGDSSIKSVSIFDTVKSAPSRHKKSEFDGIEEIGIEKFMKDVLPTCSAVEIFLKNNHEGNMVSLTTANNPDSKPIFKWDNNYSWTFNGNLAGKSEIKEQVKSKGGKVDGVLRFSMMWADGNGDNSDLDLHCITPNRREIYYAHRIDDQSKGNLDVDITTPMGKLAVENITFPSLSYMPQGVYKLFIRQFSSRSSKGFKAEIEFDGQLYSYSYDKAVVRDIEIAEVTLKKGEFTIVHKLPPSDGVDVSKEIYGLETNQFHKVNLICNSPNHWGQNNVGNKHYLFMLENCKSPSEIRGFHNENLIPELVQHRKVLEVLGATNMIKPSKKQLSGLGFNATVRTEAILKLHGTHKRIIKVKF